MKFKFAVLFALLFSTTMPAWAMEPLSSEEEDTRLSERLREPSLSDDEGTSDAKPSSTKCLRSSSEENEMVEVDSKKGNFHVFDDNLLLKFFEFLDFRGMVRFGVANTHFLHLSKGAHGYRQLCDEAKINVSLPMTPRDYFLRDYLTNPLLLLAVSEYRRGEFPFDEEKARTKIAVRSIFPYVRDLKTACRLLIHMDEFGVDIGELHEFGVDIDELYERAQHQFLEIFNSEPPSYHAEFNLYRAQMGYLLLSDLNYEETYDLFISLRPHLSPQEQALSDFLRAKMKILGKVEHQLPGETLNNEGAYDLLLSSRPYLSPYNRAYSDFFRARIRAVGQVPAETLSYEEAYALFVSSRPHLSPRDRTISDFFRARMSVLKQIPTETLSNEDTYAIFSSKYHFFPIERIAQPQLFPERIRTTRCAASFYRAYMRVLGQVPAETLSDGEAYKILESSRPGLYPQEQALSDFSRARLRALGKVPAETLSDEEAYNLFVSSRPRLSPSDQTISDFYTAYIRAQGRVSSANAG